MALTTIILDRDGVINHDSDAYIKSPQEWHPIEGSLEAIAHLKQAGFRVVIATNQSGIGRDLFTYSDLEAIHAKMSSMLATYGTVIDGIFFCPHKPEDKCNCRKPQPGLLEQIMNRWNLLPENCLLVGDSLRDIQAANAVNTRAVGVKSGKPIDVTAPEWLGVAVFNDLAAVANWITPRNHSE